jgi:hypothetical protein
MAIGTNKETAPKETTSAAITGDGGKAASSRRLKLKSPNEKKWLLVFIIIVVVIGVWWLLTNYSGGDVFKINGKKYSQAQVKQLAAYQVDKQHIPYKIAAKKVYDALSYQTAAQSVHITATPSEEKKAATNIDAATYKKYKTWIDILAYDDAVKAKLPKAIKDGAQGYVYVFWFGDAVQPSYGEPSSKYGNQQAYQADQKYAQGRANYYHDQLQNKKMTPSQVLTAVIGDPKLAPRGQPVSNPSAAFGTKTYENWQDQLNDKAIITYVKSAADNSLGSIMTSPTATRLGVNPGQYVDAYYYFVFVQKTHIPNITQRLNDARSHLNAKYYGV